MPHRVAIPNNRKAYDNDRVYRLQSDYLKYYRIIRYYFARKYKLPENDLELLLFLRGEKYFSTAMLKRWGSLATWDKERINRLIADGWIELFRMREPKKSYYRNVYHITYKAQRMMTDLYNVIEMRQIAHNANSKHRKNGQYRRLTYTEKIYSQRIDEMNEYITSQNKGLMAIRRQQRLAPVSLKTSPQE